MCIGIKKKKMLRYTSYMIGKLSYHLCKRKKKNFNHITGHKATDLKIFNVMYLPIVKCILIYNDISH